MPGGQLAPSGDRVEDHVERPAGLLPDSVLEPGKGVVDADIDVEEAWNFTQGNKNVVVAVFDTGIDLNHRDLSENIWINSGEVANNEIDDDGNGYVDDIHGWNYCTDTANVGDTDNHGSHVSGTIGAVAGNKEGIVGVSPEVSIMAIKFLPGPSFLETFFCKSNYIEIARGIRYAADNGASIMNHSWGCGVEWINAGKCKESETLNALQL